MSGWALFLISLSLLSVVAVLVIGLWQFARHNEQDKQRANLWMRLRVLFQCLTILLLLILFLLGAT
ncbi:MAG: HIG1 domain-containing protein [Alphaproteobacteria bacterium GM7ARS4]|nr:HIG1 domain-containing protein [Alphaproteobacteria bacterium GM7ARS4]